ncbi:MAG: D-alanyl-D-alanine carboxypeptidase [Defluviitaleaceae bacterium]|nr:D-alanyl-D-alanine carboxypeptidase [Defluviitaleaceae bacterium]
MKRITAFAVIVMIIFAPARSVRAGEVDEPDVRAMGAVLMDAETGRVLWGKNENTRLAMASTTKIMTAVIALENGDMDSRVTASRRAAMAPKVHMGLLAGEEVRLGDLMLALMLESSNDAAVAIAEHVGGSVEEFCAMMTAKAHSLGAVDTNFETPSGLDSDNHYSTAYDMAVITRYALRNPDFVNLINTRTATFQSSARTYNFVNRNRLLHEFCGANGVKTGFTGKAGQCFVGACRRGDMQLISVVLASGWGSTGREQKWRDNKAIMTHGFDNFRYEQIAEERQPSGAITIERSKTPQIDTVLSKGLKLPLSRQERESIVVDIHMPTAMRAPVQEGQQVGTAKVFIMGTVAEEIPIVTTVGAQRHDLKTSLEKVIDTLLEMGTNEEVNTALPEF